MGVFNFLKSLKSGQTEASSESEPPIPAEEKKYYQVDSYYTETVPTLSVGIDGNYRRRKVVTFSERQKTAFPSKNGLYPAEILLLEYCSYGTYPHPRNGYPGFWWFEYGIRNIGYYLSELERRDFIRMDPGKGKYSLTELGGAELGENKYVPIMHKEKGKTIDDATFGPIFNVWEINRRMGQEHRNDWQNIINEVKAEMQKYTVQKAEKREEFLKREESRNPKFVSEIRAMDKKIASQDAQLSKIREAEKRFEQGEDIDALIAFWENLWENGGLLFNGSKWTFRLPDLYIKQKRYDDALRILKRIDNPAYQEKKKSYIAKIQTAKKKGAK